MMETILHKSFVALVAASVGVAVSSAAGGTAFSEKVMMLHCCCCGIFCLFAFASATLGDNVNVMFDWKVNDADKFAQASCCFVSAAVAVEVATFGKDMIVICNLNDAGDFAQAVGSLLPLPLLFKTLLLIRT